MGNTSTGILFIIILEIYWKFIVVIL